MDFKGKVTCFSSQQLALEFMLESILKTINAQDPLIPRPKDRKKHQKIDLVIAQSDMLGMSAIEMIKSVNS